LNVLVTGGAGYIGSHACKGLAAQAYAPIAYDNLLRGNRWAVKWGPLEEGDMGNASRVAAVLEKYRPVALMHFAAFAYVGESVEQPLLYYRNNFVGMATLLKAVIEFHCIPVVFSSTCEDTGGPSISIDELDASGFQGAANRQIVGCRHRLTPRSSD
jgi:UDP-arabinose 4-epimerase